MTAAIPGAAAPGPPPSGDISRAEIARAIPPGSRRARDQREALRAALGCTELATVRPIFRRNLEAWIRIHANHASWGGAGRDPCATSRPGRKLVCEKIGGRGRDGRKKPLSETAYKKYRQWWQDRGYIAVVRPGWTPNLRHVGLVDPEDRNEAQVYVLCVPRRHRTRDVPAGQSEAMPLTCSRSEHVFPSRARAGQPASGPVPQHRERPRSWPLRGITDGWWAHLTRPFIAAGWTHGDLMWAIDHLPDGRQHRHRLDNVRHPVKWLDWRLSHWLDPDRRPGPGRTAQLAAAAAELRAEQAARRRQLEQAEARRSPDYTGHAARARALLAARPRPGPIDPVNMSSSKAKYGRSGAAGR